MERKHELQFIAKGLFSEISRLEIIELLFEKDTLSSLEELISILKELHYTSKGK